MSDTRRHVDIGWGPGNPDFDEYNELHRSLYVEGLTRRPIESKKDQEKDRSGRGRQGGRFGRFINHAKNTLWNLRRKNERLHDKDEQDES